MDPATASYAQTSGCTGRAGVIRLTSAQPLLPAAAATKSSAILGGQPSALDLIRAAQETGEGSSAVPTGLASSAAARIEPLEPAAGGLRPAPPSCAETLDLAASPLARARPDYSPDDFLASRRLAIGRTMFDGAWQRVRDEKISSSRLRKLVGTTSDDMLETLGAINAWVNRTIAFTDDRELFGEADYWAGAKKTLKLGRGDCEDIALTKMHLLAAAGIAREDMVLTIARDLVRNADHAVLIVRLDGRYVMLDNSTDEILDASQSHDYRPILSLGHETAWLHGY